MNIEIQPHKLVGTVKIPSSKSMAHRMLICAALSKGVSEISEIDISKDIEATVSVMQALGASFEFREAERKMVVTGIREIPETAVADCGESGSTLRFLIPVAAALGVKTTFTGQGRLPERPITPYIRELTQKNIKFQNEKIPFTMQGALQPGRFELEGDISSQFITGLLLALPLLREKSEIILTSPLQSKPYAEMTTQCMQQFGVCVKEKKGNYHIFGTQHYHAQNLSIEGDFSQAAFFYVANAVGNQVVLQNIPETSTQGDRKIVEIIEKICYHQQIPDAVFKINAKDIPDLVPILAVLATFSEKPTRITDAERLRIKESDRLETTASMLRCQRCGQSGRVAEYPGNIHPG
ncbi:MAG: 3-phosphoshikimate 1-carboxyvinyltransferase, partial [Oscillospiraceae bacterium]|nr:3-phosphoshikimate 1-carboxyvinyltransferase [Oscillospiraceae bacterium]